MNKTSPKKRLFFALNVSASWPPRFPSAKLIDESLRHITYAFLGDVDIEKARLLKEKFLQESPLPFPEIGFVGKFDQCLFLPKRHPHVVAWRASFFEEKIALLEAREPFLDWLEKQSFSLDRIHPFSTHVTIGRNPKEEVSWRKAFTPSLFYASSFHLYESLGNSLYTPLLSFPFLAPFQEIEHTGDVSYHIRGKNFHELFLHAKAALCFFFPPLIAYFDQTLPEATLSSIIYALNQMVSKADTEIGCPFKAISYNSYVENFQNYIQWEMIIDV